MERPCRDGELANGPRCFLHASSLQSLACYAGFQEFQRYARHNMCTADIDGLVNEARSTTVALM